jgi:signal transduction histidine kinase
MHGVLTMHGNRRPRKTQNKLVTAESEAKETVTMGFARWRVAIAFGSAAAVYFVALNSGLLDSQATAALNDATWTLFGLGAAYVCFASSRRLTGRERRAWSWVAFGCLSWSAGQCVWNYYELIGGKVPLFPHWMQILFIGYPLLLMAGLLRLPKPTEHADFSTRITTRHWGNLGLIACTLGGIFTIAITEPAAISHRSFASLSLSIVHCSAYALASMTALYLLWSYRWQFAYWPLVLIAAGSGVHASAFIADMHSRLAGTYQAGDWVNAAWLLALTSVACAAHEYAWEAQRNFLQPPGALMKRERLLEAVMPAALILMLATTAVMNAEWMSARVIFSCAGIAFAFAVLLGVREAWIQKEEQRLVAALNASNADLLKTNRHLSESEQRFRHLNQELERHVAERTQNLQRAYEELESFSYAVAHDLKAPLRAVDGFGALLAEEHGERLDDRGRNYVARMRRGALTMAHLVDDLLAYARIDRRETHIASTRLGELVAACIAEQREEIDRRRIDLQLDIQGITLSLDGEGLAIALRNVLQNAIKFSGATSTPQVAVRVVHENKRLVLSVRDNGIGFDMQYHDRIFAMFQRLHRADEYPGTGIGLAIARKAVERAGGRIWAESSPGAGATFFIELPAV